MLKGGAGHVWSRTCFTGVGMRTSGRAGVRVKRGLLHIGSSRMVVAPCAGPAVLSWMGDERMGLGWEGM